MAAKATGSITEHRERDGTIRYRVRITVDGKRKSLGLYDTPEHAEAIRDAALAQQGGEERGITLAAWGERWLDRRETDGLHRATSKARSCWRTHVARAAFIGWPMRRIARVDVMRWVRMLLRTEATHARTSDPRGARHVEHRGLGRTLGRQTVKNALALLRRALGDAADEGLVAVNAAAGVAVPKVARADEVWTFLDADEIASLLALDLRDDQRAIFTVAIFTGLRGGELWGLRWADVVLDGDRPELVVRHSYRGPTKSGKPRRVPLLRQAREALETWRRVKPGVGAALVFPSEGKRPEGRGGCHQEGFDAGLRRALRLAGVDRRVRFHDLRHTCASHLVIGTWGRAWRLEEVRAVLGHSSITVTERYAHLAPEGLHGARAETDAGPASGHHRDTARDTERRK